MADPRDATVTVRNGPTGFPCGAMLVYRRQIPDDTRYAMEHAPFPEADLRRRREAFADLIARAAIAPGWQRDALLSDATMLAHGHHELTGTPLLPDIDTTPRSRHAYAACAPPPPVPTAEHPPTRSHRSVAPRGPEGTFLVTRP